MWMGTHDAAKIDSNTPENPLSIWEQQGKTDQQGMRRQELRKTARQAERLTLGCSDTGSIPTAPCSHASGLKDSWLQC